MTRDLALTTGAAVALAALAWLVHTDYCYRRDIWNKSGGNACYRTAGLGWPERES